MTTEKTDALATREPELPEPVVRRGVTEAAWRTLCNNLFPGANPKSVLMVLDYCASRGLDPMKKPCHIVPMEVKIGNAYEWRDVVMPGIYEYRITAHRTGDYLGHDEPVYGEDQDFGGVQAPAWCLFTAYRYNVKAAMKVPFPVKTFFAEVVATKRDGKPNSRWSRAPKQMLAKCAEAAALREAFPEEIGGEPTAEEMDGHRPLMVDVKEEPAVAKSVGVLALEQLPEGVQDNINRAFEALTLTPAQRLTKLNEFLGAKGVDLAVASEGLLLWCQEETKKRANGPKKAKTASNDANKKDPPTATAGANTDPSAMQVTPTTAPSAVQSHVNPSGNASSDGRPAWAEVPSQGSGQVAPASLFDGVEF